MTRTRASVERRLAATRARRDAWIAGRARYYARLSDSSGPDRALAAHAMRLAERRIARAEAAVRALEVERHLIDWRDATGREWDAGIDPAAIRADVARMRRELGMEAR